MRPTSKGRGGERKGREGKGRAEPLRKNLAKGLCKTVGRGCAVATAATC